MRAYLRVGRTKFSKINFRNSIFTLISENYSFQKFPAIWYNVISLQSPLHLVVTTILRKLNSLPKSLSQWNH